MKLVYLPTWMVDVSWKLVGLDFLEIIKYKYNFLNEIVCEGFVLRRVNHGVNDQVSISFMPISSMPAIEDISHIFL